MVNVQLSNGTVPEQNPILSIVRLPRYLRYSLSMYQMIFTQRQCLKIVITRRNRPVIHLIQSQHTSDMEDHSEMVNTIIMKCIAKELYKIRSVLDQTLVSPNRHHTCWHSLFKPTRLFISFVFCFSTYLFYLTHV